MTIRFTVTGFTAAEMREEADRILTKFLGGGKSATIEFRVEPLVEQLGISEPKLWTADVEATA